MPFTHARRRGATVLFRRKIPVDLRDRFGSHEIVRSIGRATPGEARRIVHRLWSQTELVFMRVRSEQALTRGEIAKVVAAAVDAFQDDIEIAIADVIPGVPLSGLDEPVDRADRLRGEAALYGSMLDRNDVVVQRDNVSVLAQEVVGKDVQAGSNDERRLCRAVTEGLQAAAGPVAAVFDRLARFRPATSAVRLIDEAEYEATPEVLTAMRAAKVGDDVSVLIDQLRPVTTDVPVATPTSSVGTSPLLRNADELMSALWPRFASHKVLMEEWKRTEADATKTTLKHWLECCGDKKPGDYTTEDVSAFHAIIKELPSNYYHNSAYRSVYEANGVRAVVAMSKGHVVDRMSNKTWNSHNSTLNGFFLWCAGKGAALPKGTESVCAGEFVCIPKKAVRRQDDPSRIIYEDRQIRTLFSAPKYTGAKSGHYWKQTGPLVTRDHRYWLPLIGALHGARREEPTLLKVKHVRLTAGGVAYFNWTAPELYKGLKDVGSPRDVPLHRDLLRLGFMDARVHGRDPEAPLFPDAVSYGAMERNAEPFGSWFGLFRKHCGVVDPRLDFHSWRHTAETLLLRAGVPQSHVEEIVGHESEGRRSAMSAVYNHGMSVELLKISIDRLSLPIDVEALIEAVRRSDAVDRSAAWPDLSDPKIRPKPKASRRSV